MTRPAFSIVVVTWNSTAELPGLIGSIDEHLDGRYELVFVDNASPDGTAALIRELSPDGVLVEPEANIGFGPGNNLGVREASGDVVILLNPDTLLVDRSLEALARLAGEEGALCGPRLLNEDGSWQISAHPRPASWPVAVAAVWPTALMPPGLASRCDPSKVDRRVRVGWLSAACLAAPRDLMLELGPFDEHFHFDGDDTDLGVRAGALGIERIFAPDLARVIHLGERSVSQHAGYRTARRVVEGRAEVVRRNLGAGHALFDHLAQLLAYGSRWLVKRLLGRPDAERDRAFTLALLRPAANQRHRPG